MTRTITLARTLLVAGLFVALVAAPLPSWATEQTVSVQVGAALERWENAAGEVHAAARELDAAQQVFVAAQEASVSAERAREVAEAAVREATGQRDALRAELPDVERALARAQGVTEVARGELEAAAWEREEHQDHLAARQAEHATALAALRGLGWQAGVLGRGGLVWPTDGEPGSRFGPRRHPITNRVRLHAGVDVGAPTGQPVFAAAAGTVTSAGASGGYGLMVEIDHGDGRVTRYAHLSSIVVHAGEQVVQARHIGDIGSTGLSTGPHLHFEVRVDGTPRDPLDWFAEVIR